MRLLTLLSDIFLEAREDKVLLFSPEDLTDHYRKELWEITLDHIYIATTYSQIEEKVRRYKYSSEREHVDLFVDLLSKIVEHYQIFLEDSTMLVPVPMHWGRYMTRWFDHTGLMTKHLSKILHIPSQRLLTADWTRHQSKLTREKRLENKTNTFTIKYRSEIPHTVILIDDIISTGSTANECAKVLKKAWVQKIIGVFLASNI
jgi:competence protein ComFC